MSKLIQTALICAFIASAGVSAHAQDKRARAAGTEGAQLSAGEISKRNIILGVLGVAAVAAALDDSDGTTSTVQ